MPENTGEGGQREGSRIEPNPRQQGKIIVGFLARTLDVFDHEEVHLLAGERETYLYAVSQGLIDTEDRKTLLRGIKAPFQMESSEVLFSKIQGDDRIKDIITRLALNSTEQREPLSQLGLRKFVELFPDPIALEDPLKKLLRLVEWRKGSQEQSEYELSARILRRTVYGKRWEYYQQMELLDREAAGWANNPGTQRSYEAHNPLIARLIKEHLYEMARTGESPDWSSKPLDLGYRNQGRREEPARPNTPDKNPPPPQRTPFDQFLYDSSFDLDSFSGMNLNRKKIVVGKLRGLAGIRYHPDNGITPNEKLLAHLNASLDQLDPNKRRPGQ